MNSVKTMLNDNNNNNDDDYDYGTLMSHVLFIHKQVLCCLSPLLCVQQRPIVYVWLK